MSGVGPGRGPVQLTIAFVATQFDFKFKLPSTKSVTINWGDGTTEVVVGTDAALITKTSSYAGAGTFSFYITGDVTELTYIDISGQAFVSGDVSGFSTLTNLTFIHVGVTDISGDISGWSVLTSLTTLFAHSTSVSGDISGLSALTSLSNILLSTTNVTGDISGWSTLTSLTGGTALWIQLTDVTFDGTPSWTANNATINLYSINGSGATSQMIDNMIKSLSTCTDCTIRVDGTNAHRTAASNDDLNTLLANGNTITLNDVLSAEKITDPGFPDATNWDVTDVSWSIGAGVAAYDDANDDAGLLQVDGDMVSSIAVDTVYRAEFTTDATPTNADLAIKNSAEDVVYFAKATYADGTHVVYFTSPSDISGGGLGFVAYQSGDAFDLDDVS